MANPILGSLLLEKRGSEMSRSRITIGVGLALLLGLTIGCAVCHQVIGNGLYRLAVADSRSVAPERQSAAVRRMKLAARLGSTDAMVELGFDYRDGNGTAVDRAEAARWYERAAERGDATATELLGEAFLSGEGVEVNREKAFHLMDKAARAGNAVAEFNVGTLYLQGEVVPQDRVKAAEYLSKAVKSGFRKALVNLANCYAMGEGAPHDDMRAFQIYQEAADVDHSPVAAFNVAITYLGRGPVRVPIDSQKGLHYLEMAADGGFLPAVVQVADVALNEQHDLTRYKQLMKRAAELGYTPATLTR